MNRSIKNKAQIQKMRVVGKMAAEVLEYVSDFVKIGATTNELNDICHAFITKKQKAIPAPLNYKGFPKSICTSINDEVCHGIPSDRVLKNGDILNIDVTVKYDGYHGDTSKMFEIGTITKKSKKLIDDTYTAMLMAIRQVRHGITTGTIGSVIQNYANKKNLGIVKEYCGHGIGEKFHEWPNILHWGEKNKGERLVEGMTFTIEPMLNLGKDAVYVTNDDWTVKTKDGKYSAQWEHTILITDNGYEILTKRNDETI